MTASTYPVNTPDRAGAVSVYPVAAAAQINAGALVALNSTGFIVPASNTVGLMVLGRAEEEDTATKICEAIGISEDL